MVPRRGAAGMATRVVDPMGVDCAESPVFSSPPPLDNDVVTGVAEVLGEPAEVAIARQRGAARTHRDGEYG